VWTAYDESDFGLSYTLGTNPVNPLEMASAYATFADQGVHVDPSPVVKAVDSQGRIVYDDTHPKGRRVLSSYVADTINSILQGVVQHGTGYPNALIGRPAAGKTGTANGPTDAWFVGYTPQLSAAVWMGYSNNETTPMLDVKGVQVYGATYPAAAWHDYMVAALAGVPPEPFPAPSQAPPAPAPTLRPGPSMSPAAPPSGPYVAPAPPPPTAVAPYFEPTTSVPASGPSPTSQPAPVSSPGPTGSTASTSPPGSASPSGSTGSSTSAPGR
jgi:membrane peptidoglycan carboxypeptidase